MKFNEEKLTMEIEKKDEELSRIQGEQLQEQLKAKQLDNLPTDIKVSTCIHAFVHTYICVINVIHYSMWLHNFYLCHCTKH